MTRGADCGIYGNLDDFSDKGGTMKTRQFKKITVLQPKPASGCAPGAAQDPDAPPC
ncbi:hypothetical protein GPEL0_01f0367 [Geoanaerobacter pelophilus]|uniref:Uncharacterized protein n=1 Tax=Geoanaerobacter pelophilus TaxID=60036 RepID=A0ABQ0MED8_9BACT|nr:hypothetical protein GPEL0_01f0367 [Geoanaerobacter pelophilus]